MLWPTLFTCTAVLLVAALIVLVWLYVNLRTSRDHGRALTQSLEVAHDQQASLQKELANYRPQIAQAEKELAVAQETKRNLEKQFDLIQKQSRQTFESLAGDVLKNANAQFLQLAKKSFETEQKDANAQLAQRQQAIEHLIKPVRESLDKHAKAVGDIEKQREGAYQGLSQRLTAMLEAQHRLGDQTTALTTALKGSSAVRGRWGEITLRRIVEMAGMVSHCDFDEQVTVWKGDDALRPDMVVHLPSQRSVVIDAKAVGESYFQSAMEASDATQRKELLTRHAKQIESRVRDLSSKGYAQNLTHSADFVVLFVPGEALLHAALEFKPDLSEQAMAKGVVIATPTVLVSLLRVIEMGWREEKMAQNARQISQLGQELHERMGVAIRHLSNLGKAIGKSVEHYNKFVKSFDTRVVVSARKLEQLGASSAKPLPGEGEIEQIEASPQVVESA